MRGIEFDIPLDYKDCQHYIPGKEKIWLMLSHPPKCKFIKDDCFKNDCYFIQLWRTLYTRNKKLEDFFRLKGGV